MTTQEVSQMLAGIGLPYAYDHFTKDDTPGGPPFICFVYPDSDNFSADGRVYQRITSLDIELYTDEKDITLERAVEEALDDAGLYYESHEEYLESEHMFMVRWETEILLTVDKIDQTYKEEE